MEESNNNHTEDSGQNKIALNRMEQLTKQHQVSFYTTVKFQFGIIPNGTFHVFHPVKGEPARDIHIAQDSGLLKKLELLDKAMADRGFKIQSDLLSCLRPHGLLTQSPFGLEVLIIQYPACFARVCCTFKMVDFTVKGRPCDGHLCTADV